jgi:hypothetical protein
MDATKDAPGRNDDGSGTAAVIEAARVLSRHKFPTRSSMRCFRARSRGLLGGKIMADYAKAQGWEVIANLNNDIIGNSCGSTALRRRPRPRLLRRAALAGREDLPRASAASAARMTARRAISPLPSPSSRDLGLGLDVRQIWRNDRFGRGGDHTEMLNAVTRQSASRSRWRITTTSTRTSGSRMASSSATP